MSQSLHSASFEDVRDRLDGFLWPEQDPRQRAKRERILAAATELFVRFGYRKTAVEEVARTAGVAKGTVYLYYATKAELMIHAVALEKRGSLDRFEGLLDAAVPAEERLSRLIASGLIIMRELPLQASLTAGDREVALVMQDMQEGAAAVLAEINGWQADFVGFLLDEASDKRFSAGEIEKRARVLIDLISAVAGAPQTASANLSPAEFAWTVARTIVHGLLDDRPLPELSVGSPETAMEKDDKTEKAMAWGALP